MNYDRATRLKKAKLLRESAKRYLAQHLKSFKEKDMIQMFRQDGRDMREIAKLIRENKLDKAESCAQSMDTAAREAIPDSVWNWLVNRD